MPVIEAKNINVTLNGHHILADISFDVEKGEVIAIVGPNGSGKTTLLKTLLGLVPHKGEIKLFGYPPRARSAVASRIGYVPQRLDFDRTMPVTVKELLSVYAKTPEEHFLKKTLALVGAEYLLDRRLGLLSGGEFQRVLIALALLHEPEILFLDEPAASIDVEGAGEVYELIRTLQKEKGMTILLVSHDIDIVIRYADRVLCVNHRLLCSGHPHEALTKETLEKLYGVQHTLYPHKEKQ